MSEDCLYLNVYTPIPKNQPLLPVMLFFHGGNFQFGSGGSALSLFYLLFTSTFSSPILFGGCCSISLPCSILPFPILRVEALTVEL